MDGKTPSLSLKRRRASCVVDNTNIIILEKPLVTEKSTNSGHLHKNKPTVGKREYEITKFLLQNSGRKFINQEFTTFRDFTLKRYLCVYIRVVIKTKTRHVDNMMDGTTAPPRVLFIPSGAIT